MKKQISYKLLLLLIFSLIPVILFSQSTITGTVKIGSGGDPFSGVFITIEGTAIGATTTSSGEYSIGYSSGVQITLVATYTGYSPISKTITLEPGINWMNFWFNPPDLPSDYDDNYYPTVVIGQQEWLAENLTTTHLNDGTSVPNLEGATSWSETSSPAFSWYDNDADYNKDNYGALYNWYAVGTEGLCPPTWHVPSNYEWTQLITHLGGEEGAGGILKETGTEHWLSPNFAATDDVGFTALPGGVRLSDGTFTSIGGGGLWWTSTAEGSGAWYTGISYDGASILMNGMSLKAGMSVRCMRDQLSVLTTTPVTSISSSSALSGGEISYDGGNSITQRGVCWSTSAGPTIADSHTEDGAGTGAFISNITGLTPNTTYYVRAYATNSVGTAYGDEISFTTPLSERQIDSLALVDLYNSTNGPDWTNNTNWLTGPIDSWYGIFLSGDRVSSIRLMRNNLTGTITDNIGILTGLTKLLLASNSISGQIPISIRKLVNLDDLYLTDNQLSGYIPPEIGDLTNLTKLSIGMNYFTDSIPSTFGQLTQLTELELTNCQLEGEIPPELGNLSNLEYLLLKNNNLSGEIPGQIYSLSNLIQLHVGINNLSGTIPPEIGNLSNLQLLMLYDNQFSGELPVELGTLSQLARLDIGSNSFTGALPGGITGLTSLLHIKIENNQFSSLPDLSSLPALDSLFVQNNMLTFKDIEPNIGAAAIYFEYAPQANITAENDSILYLASEMALSVSTGGDYSQYQWYKDGSPLGSLSGDSTLSLNPVNLDDSGDYKCVVTNTLATELTLFSDTATLEVLPAILVHNTNDSGNGSLRNAIDYANSNPGRDSIIFDIDIPGVTTITPLTPLPVITDPLVIDGYTQPGTEKATETSPATLLLHLDGINLIDDVWHSGLQIQSGNSTIRGLIINQFADGIHIHINGGNIIEGNYIGVDYTGLVGTPGNTEGAVRIWDCSGNIIGGDSPWQRNIIASESGHNVQILLSEAYDNIIKNNFIGVGADGETEVGNTEVGVRINEDAHHNTIGPGNIISGHSLAGINIEVGPHDNTIIGNKIGTNKDGNGSVPNENGIQIISASNNIVGGSTDYERNIISGNGMNGIYISGNSTSDNHIIGNYIGTGLDGKQPVPNGQGVNIDNEATENYIGGSLNGTGNLIAYNTGAGIGLGSHDNYVMGNEIIGNSTIGIFITGNTNTIGGPGQFQRNYIYGNSSGISIFPESSHNHIEGNYLGTDRNGFKDMTDGWDGISVGGSYNEIINNLICGYTHQGIQLMRWDSEEETNPNPVPQGNLIKGNLLGLDADGTGYIPNGHGISFNSSTDNSILNNTIAGNTFNGIQIGPDLSIISINNLISANSIYANGELGIDLESGAFTENDNLDIDEGPNNLQNYPVLDSLSFKPGYVTVGGYLNSTPNTSFNLQFFASKIGDNTTYGEGQFYLGSDSVVTDANGDASYTSTFPIKGTMGQVITATATDPDGNTSEFSRLIGGVKDHILSEINNPFYYYINKDGLPTISDDSDLDAIRSAFQTWTNVPYANIEFIDAGTTTSSNASATDGVNLVTFRDEDFPFAPGILAVAAKTLKISPEGDMAEILDADIVFNPHYVNSIEWYFGIAESDSDTTFFDVQSVTTHEIGHLLGMIHTGAPLSTMFFMISPGTSLRSLEKDDIAWASYRYPDTAFSDNYALISGNITYGDIGDVSDPKDPGPHPSVAGALVLAVNSVTKEQIHAYTDAYGNYEIPVPVDNGTTESYWILIQPLDGDVFGFPLRPGNISSYIYSNTIYTDYPNEWYNGLDEGATDMVDDVSKGILVDVAAGDIITGINLITNKDDLPPSIIDVIPSATSYNDTVNITSDIIIRFSEPVEIKTFTDESCFLTWDTLYAGGDYWYFYEDSIHIIGFSPERPMKYATEYSVHLTEAITDLKQNYLSLDNEIITTFKTRLPDTNVPAIEDIIPEPDTDSVFVSSSVRVMFSEPMDHNITGEGLKISTPDGKVLEGDYDWSSYNTYLKFTPWRYLLEGTEYTVSISTDLVDISGNPIEKDSVMTFTTVPQANPEIIYIGPSDNAEGITVETPIVVDFSEPINITTVTPATFKLLGSDGSQISGYVEALIENSRIIFRPYTYLEYGQSYTIMLTTGIYDESDPALPLASDSSSTFTCTSEPVSPYIHYLDPPSGVVGSLTMLSGSGYDPDPVNNLVYFNGTKASVKKSTLSTIAVEVPIGAVSGPVTVTVNGHISNPMHFSVLTQTLDPCEEITANITTGSKSRDVAVDPETGLAYVTNSLSGTVSVIGLNLDTPMEIETIKVGDYPMSIDIDPMGTHAYVTNFYSHTVSAINLIDYSVKNIPVGENPYGVVVSPDGKVYVSNTTSENVSVIDVNPQSGGFDHVIANINTGTKNRDIDISPEAGYVLVAGDNGLTIINVNPDAVDYNSVIANVNTGTRTRDVEVSPEAGLAIVSTEDGNLFLVDIYPDSETFGAVIANINTGTTSRDIEISPEALFVYVTNEEGSVSVYKIDYGVPGTTSTSYFRQIGLTLHTLISAEDIRARELEGLTIGHDGKKLYVVNPDYMDGKGQVIEIKLCCGPVPSETSIGNMIINVQNLLNEGYISEGEANALLTKLNNVLEKLDKGQTHVAINILGAFIEQLIELKESGSIPEDRADAMIYATYAIIYELENPPLKGLNLDEENIIKNGKGFLERLYPNPFSEELYIHFNTLCDSGEDIFVDIRIYNFNGQLVKILTSMYMPPGNYLLKWDGKYDNGQKGTGSIYFIDFRAGKTKITKTLVYQK